ncbi:MAG: hypothetical protein IT159_00020 [Bryobacterales bacterium]|nr:hypothetical protein [Bryobacterales bacterium]
MAALAACSCAGLGAELKKETLEDFARHIQAAEARVAEMAAGKRSFLWLDESPQRRGEVRSGQVAAQLLDGRRPQQVRGGLIHHWIGAVFVPGVTLDSALALLRNYDEHQTIYRPEVMASKVLEHDQDRYRVYLRLLKKKVLTVVLNTEHDVRYFPLDPTRCHSRSYSTKIAQVENPGEPGERERPPGQDDGFLWRLYSYWRLQQRDGGVYLECEAVSLTRDIPNGLGWLIEPIIRDLPKESLVKTLVATRMALAR